MAALPDTDRDDGFLTASSLLQWRAKHPSFAKTIPTMPFDLDEPGREPTRSHTCWPPRRVEPGAIVSDDDADRMLQPMAAEACTDTEDLCRPSFNRGTLAVLAVSGVGMVGVIAWAVLARWG